MPTFVIGKVAYDTDDAGMANAVTDALDDKQAKIDELEKAGQKLQGTADALKVKLDAAEDEAKKKEEDEDEDKAKVDAEVTKRMDAAAAVLTLTPEVKIDGMNAADMKRESLKALGMEAKIDGKDDAYIDAAFDIMQETKAGAIAGDFNKGSTPKADAANDPRAKFMAKKGA